MAYTNYFPMNYPYYQPYQQTQPAQQNVQQTQTAGVNWVQGEAGARSWLLAPNQTVLLMDSESERFFIKSADNSGMPLPLRIFEYKELTDAPKQPVPSYVTRDEFEALRKEVNGLLPKKEKKGDIKDADPDF